MEALKLKCCPCYNIKQRKTRKQKMANPPNFHFFNKQEKNIKRTLKINKMFPKMLACNYSVKYTLLFLSTEISYLSPLLCTWPSDILALILFTCHHKIESYALHS